MPKSVTLTLPTTNQDGSTIAAGDLVDVQVGFGTATGNYTLIADDTAFASQTNAGIVTIPWASLNENLGFGTCSPACESRTRKVRPSAWSTRRSSDYRRSHLSGAADVFRCRVVCWLRRWFPKSCTLCQRCGC